MRQLKYLLLFFFVFTLCPIHSEESTDFSKDNLPVEESVDTASFLTDSFGADNPKAVSFYGAFFKMMATLGVILAVVLVIAWFFKRILNQKVQLLNKSNHIKIIEKRTLSQKSMLYLVEVHDKQVIISESANNGVQYIADCPYKTSDDAAQEQPIKKSFSDLIMKKINNKKPTLNQK